MVQSSAWLLCSLVNGCLCETQAGTTSTLLVAVVLDVKGVVGVYRHPVLQAEVDRPGRTANRQHSRHHKVGNGGSQLLLLGRKTLLASVSLDGGKVYVGCCVESCQDAVHHAVGAAVLATFSPG